jgi:hypothetical protein
MRDASAKRRWRRISASDERRVMSMLRTHSLRLVAQRFDIPLGSMAAFAQRAGIKRGRGRRPQFSVVVPPSKLTPERCARIRADLALGVSIREAGRRNDISHVSVLRMLKE